MYFTKHHIPCLAALLVLLLIACTSEEERGIGKEPSALMPTAGFGADTPQSGDNFKEGDIVWAWADRYGKRDGYIKAWKLTATGVDGKLASPNRKQWPRDNSDLTIQALHGEFDEELIEGETELSSLTHTISTDQSVAENRDRSDLLYAMLSPAKYQSRLTFFHMLSKIKIILKDTEGIEGEGGVPEASITNAAMGFRNIATAVKMDLGVDKATSTSPYADVNLGTTTADDHTAEAIIPPQAIAPDEEFFELVLHDFPRKDSVRTFHFVAPKDGVIFEPGKEYTYTISVKNLLRVKPVDVPVWGWENIETTLVWSRFFFGITVMDWNGLVEYSHQWSWLNFLPTIEEWDGQDYVYTWAWEKYSPELGDWMETEKKFEIPQKQ